MSTYWPGTGITKSTGNAFDLSMREHSIFYDPKAPPPKPSKRRSKAPKSETIPSVKGLSQRGREQLSKSVRTHNVTALSKSSARRSKGAA